MVAYHQDSVDYWDRVYYQDMLAYHQDSVDYWDWIYYQEMLAQPEVSRGLWVVPIPGAKEKGNRNEL